MYKIKSDTGLCNLAGKKIKEYRLRKNLSLRDMASVLQSGGLDWDKNAVNRAEQGKRAIIDLEVVKLAQIMNITCDELLKR